ncbi:hypothetical protein AB0N88_01530 [Streptomyces sp. NPDC093516]|uniref:hypothetical protein n=1 Tax=Streptomyces sp. NPDC093516 TaxID=3155304 RepID=UPI00342EE469
MDEDIRGGEAAVARLVQGAPLEEALDVANPGAWTALDVAVRARAWYRPEELPDRAWAERESSAGRGLFSFVRRRSGSAPSARSGLSAVPSARSGRSAPSARSGSSAEPRLALALCHPDGRTREAALARSAQHPALLPLVIVRAADWAAPVRDRARELLRKCLDPDTAVALAPLILRVGRRDRGAYAVELLGEVLRQAPPHGRAASLFVHPDRRVRRFAYRLACEAGLLSPGRLARTAARDEDVVVQTLCADACLAAVRESGHYDDVLEPLLAAPSPRARSAGVTALRPAGRSERGVEFLADRSALVRACARYVVRQGGADPLPWYRRCAQAGDPALPPGAVAGLAECGDRGDAALLRPLLAHPVPAVRARAVAGLRVLDVMDVERIRPLLDDPAPGVVREAAAALLPSAALLPEAWLMEHLAPERPPRARLAAYRLLEARGGIVRLRAAVSLLGDPDARLRTRAARAVRGWYPPEVREDEEGSALLARARHVFAGGC